MPAVTTGTFAGTASSFPLGRSGGRVQYWYRGDNLPRTPLATSIGTRPVRGVTMPGRTQSIEVTMANVAITSAGFTNNFAGNLGAQPTIAFAARAVALPPLNSHQDPDAPAVWMALDAPFVMTGPNLIVQFDLGPAAGAASAPPNGDMLNMAAANSSRHFVSGTSCGGALAATSTTSDWTLTLTGAQPNQPAWFLVSGDAFWSSNVQLPLRLDVIGMTGCFLGVDPTVVIATTTGAAGSATLLVPFPTPPQSQVVYGQAIHTSATTPAGLATTNVARSVLGNAGLVNYIYNFTVDGPNAQNGPYAYNITGNLLFRP